MFGRKHKQSTKQKIAQSLKRKASRAIVKGAGAAGYVVGRVGPAVANSKITKAASSTVKAAANKTPNEVKKTGKEVSKKVVGPGVDKVTRTIGRAGGQLEKGTRVKAAASFVGGATKGTAKSIKGEYAKQKRKAK